MYPDRTETSKDECVGHLAAAFDAVLNHERLSIHVRAHLMEALAKVQSSAERWKSGSGEVCRELASLREFARRHLPATAAAVRDRIELVADACEVCSEDSGLDEADEVRAGQASAPFRVRAGNRRALQLA